MSILSNLGRQIIGAPGDEPQLIAADPRTVAVGPGVAPQLQGMQPPAQFSAITDQVPAAATVAPAAQGRGLLGLLAQAGRPDANGMTFWDRLNRAGAQFQDISDGGHRTRDLTQENASRTQQAAQRALALKFGQSVVNNPSGQEDPELLASIMNAAGQGLDPTPWLAQYQTLHHQAQEHAYLDTLPADATPEERAAATLNPSAYANYALTESRPKIVASDGNIYAVDPRTGTVLHSQMRGATPPQGYRWGPDGVSLEVIPGGPADPKYIQGKSQAEASGSRAGAPPEPNTGQVMGPILGKVARGEPLAPGEQQLWNVYRLQKENPLIAGAGEDGAGYGAGAVDSGAAPQAAPANARQQNNAALRGRSAAARAPAAASSRASSSADTLKAQARDAIGRGADRRQVLNRLIKMGVNPAGL